MLLGDQNRSAAKLIEIFADQRRVRDNALRRSQCGHFDEWIIVDDMPAITVDCLGALDLTTDGEHLQSLYEMVSGDMG
jgi:hypothetical protein